MPERSHRQLAAILFTDMVGYTALMAEDEAFARRLRDRHREVLRNCHEMHRGEILQYFGDGTLSIFASSVNAVKCAIDIQLALQKEPKVPLRIGIHSGEVVWDQEGIYGSAVNVASRLESFATNGSILVSAKVKEELNNQRYFQFKSLGLFTLKNVTKPVEVFAVINEGIDTPRIWEIEGKGKRLQGAAVKAVYHLEHFVGRGNELKILCQTWNEVKSGKGMMIGISGEPGIGKTTLSEDFLLQISEGNVPMTIARGRCSERLAGTEAYLPFLEILEELILQDQYAQLLRQLAPAWYVQIRPYSIEESKTLEIATQTTQEIRKREIGNFFAAIAGLKPLFLFIDDLHWADESSIDLLAYLAPRWNTACWLILATYRPADMKLLENVFVSLKSELQAKGRYREIALPYFKLLDIKAYLKKQYPENQFRENFCIIIHQRTEGNPLFVADLVRLLEEQGAIYQETGIWKVIENLADFSGLPESISGIISKKLERLDEEDRQLLSVASIQGYEFDGLILASVLNWDLLKVSKYLQKLEEVHLLVHYEGERSFPDGTISEHFQFVHALYQNELFKRVRGSYRNLWGRTIAEELQDLGGEQVSAIASELSRLYELASEPDKASEYYLLAAEHALGKTGHQEVLTLVAKGLHLLEQLPASAERKERQLDLRLSMGPSLMILKGFGSPELGDNYQKATELCKNLKNSWKAFKTLNGIWLYSFNSSDLLSALKVAQEMKTIAERETEDTYTIVADHALADILSHLGKIAEAKVYYENVLRLYDKNKHGELSLHLSIEDPAVGSYSVGSLCLLLLGYPEKAQNWCNEGIKLGHDLPESTSLSIALLVAQIFYASLKEIDLTQEYVEKTINLFPEREHPMVEGFTKIIRGWVKIINEKDKEGLTWIQEGKTTLNAGGSHLFHFLRVLIIESYLFMGEFRKCELEIRDAIKFSNSVKSNFYEPEVYRLKANLILAQQQNAKQEAEKWLEKSLELAQTQHNRLHELRSTISLVRIWQSQGKAEEAFDKLSKVYDWFSEGFDTIDLKNAKTLLKILESEII